VLRGLEREGARLNGGDAAKVAEIEFAVRAAEAVPHNECLLAAWMHAHAKPRTSSSNSR